MNKKKNNKTKSLTTFALAVAIVVFTNIISSFFFSRLDLTTDKRFSLSESTLEKVKSLDDFVFVKVYLEGDLPADFKLLRNSTKEMLDEFRAYNKNIQYEFINPSEKEDKKERFKVYRQLAQEGLAYYIIPIENKDGPAQKTIFASAQLIYRDKTLPLNLIVSSRSTPTNADINNSIQKLELNFLTALHNLTTEKLKTIAFTTGHGELPPLETADLAMTLAKSYNISQVKLDGKINALNKRVAMDSTHTVVENKFDLIIISKPDSAFNEADKFIIDQYIMHGGKVIWLIDANTATMDSLHTNKTTTIGMPKNLNLDDLFFKYGVRIKTNLVLNRNSLEIGTAEGALRRWDYFPLALPKKGHLITDHIETLKTQFVNSLDTISISNVKKTILLTTDKNCRLIPAPAVVDVVDMIYRRPNPVLYNQPPQTIGVLMEGKFRSNYENRIADPRIIKEKDFDIRNESPVTSMVFFSDGDLVRNQVIQQQNGPFPLPLGFDRYTQKMFDNKKFILNTINYMLGDNNLIKLRNKELRIRLLDRKKISKSKLTWQLINTIIPISLILLTGMIIGLLKKYKYTKN